MTVTEGLANILLAMVNFALLWILVGCWRSYRVDVLRHRLFVLRDELFDYALDGNLAFDHPAYEMLRHKINNLLRFTHKIGFMRLLIFILFGDKIMASETLATHKREWLTVLEQLSDKQREKLEKLHERVLLEIFKHMIFGKPVLIIPFVWSRIRASLLRRATIVEIEAEHIPQDKLPSAA